MTQQLPVAEGGRASGGGGLGSHWMLIAGIAGVGVVAILLTKGGGSSSGTTAAGTSINAALGSIQEQNLNLMGQLGASTAALSSQATDYHNSELAALSGMQDSITAQITGLDGHLTSLEGDLSSQIADVNGNVIANGQSISGLSGKLDAYYSSLIAAGATNTQAVQQTQSAFWQAAMQAIANVQNSVGGTQSDVDAVARFLGWEFYQIPNRYAAYIPGQSPSAGNVGSTPLGML
jgi:hypothetical protein